jgi:hypothetical protein
MQINNTTGRMIDAFKQASTRLIVADIDELVTGYNNKQIIFKIIGRRFYEHMFQSDVYKNKLFITNALVWSTQVHRQFCMYRDIVDAQLNGPWKNEYYGYYSNFTPCFLSVTNNKLTDLNGIEHESVMENFIGIINTGIYFDSNGIMNLGFIRGDFVKNIFTVDMLNAQATINFVDVYIDICGTRVLSTTTALSFFSLLHPSTIQVRCDNLDKNIFFTIHNDLQYTHYESELRIAGINYKKILCQNVEFLFRKKLKIITITNDIFYLRPIIIGSVIGHHSPLRLTSGKFIRDSDIKMDIDLATIQFIVEIIVLERIPQLIDLIQTNQIENISFITMFCDYFDLDIYKDYFNAIINHTSFDKLFT